ncbi:MAG TPA: Lpg1974 family pore-forming outer membrane protein [Chlamydiales bacterium]|nr:Lpg1974 family pore-forming outer membrane protein [Chlamydiales bacterium]
MNLFPKTAPWVVVSLIAASSAFGEDNQCCPSGPFYEQGHELVCTQLPAAYNAPARIQVDRCYDVYAEGSFIYWQPKQENMELGIADTIAQADTDVSGIQGNLINENFQYKPGFKVGVGMNFDYDGWDGYAEYTWLHGKNSTDAHAPTTALGNILPLWGSPLNEAASYTSVVGTWRFKFDFLDAELARSYYVGRKLSLRPYFGLRGAWIRQKHTAVYAEPPATVPPDVGLVREWTTINQSVSWGIGPRAGVGANWLFRSGFRVYGDAAVDMLYTRYNLSEREHDTFAPLWNQDITQSHIDYLRTHLDFELGLGWGSYFHCNRWHVDLSAGYGFQAFFDQNMFRHYNTFLPGSYSRNPNGNLYIQGLTAMMRFDY